MNTIQISAWARQYPNTINCLKEIEKVLIERWKAGEELVHPHWDLIQLILNQPATVSTPLLAGYLQDLKHSQVVKRFGAKHTSLFYLFLHNYKQEVAK